MICEQSLKCSYTTRDEPLINRTIAQQLAEISRGILSETKDIVALFLTGGYSRGEGSVLFVDDDIVLLGDYDILAISLFPHFHGDFSWLRSLEKKFRVQYHIEVSILWEPLLSLLGKRIYSYELKFGSRLIFGNPNVLDLIHVSGGWDIDINEGYSLMFNRLMGLLEVFDLEFLDGSPITRESQLHLLFQSVKTILSCGESLLLLNHRYHFSYEERLRRLQQCFKKDFGDLAKLDPSLEIDYEKASQFKLAPKLGMYHNPLELWFDAKEHVLQTLLFYMIRTKRSMRETLQMRCSDFPDLFLNSSKIDLLGFAKFNWNSIRKRGSLKGLNRFRPSYSDIVRASIFCLALSLQRDGSIDEEFLQRASRLVEGLIPINKKMNSDMDLQKRWRLVRDCVYLAWTLIRQ